MLACGYPVGGSHDLYTLYFILYTRLEDLTTPHRPGLLAQLAPMSTSTDIAVAARYASSGDSLLFKISLDNFMQCTQ